MNKKKTLSLVFALFSFAAFAQESAQADISTVTPEIKLSYLDSIKSTFTRHSDMVCVDSLWLKELTNQDLFENMQDDLKKVNPDVDVEYGLSTDLLKERLAKMDAKSPFNIEYSKGLENIIKSYLKNRPKSYERLMAISEYYFPMFEERLAKYNVPIEIKYLAVIESALNPRAKSRVGATGLWQFMYPTGKQYNLEVNSYVDERSDPLKATEAACQYLSSLYNMFGDWDLVLASYNAGPGNVTKAIRRSGTYKNYWNIRQNLPKETQAYVPTFLATMYIYEYAKEHGINAKKAPITYFETDTIMVKRQMSFKQVAQLLDVPVSQLQLLNPIYKLDIIPFTSDKAHFLRLPKEKIGIFVSNEKSIYAYIDYEDSKRERPRFGLDKPETAIASSRRDSTSSRALASASPYKREKSVTTKTHVVKKGDNLGEIATKYDVSLADLRKWNKIKGNNIMAGQRIKIQKTITVTTPVKEEAIAAVKEKETKGAKTASANAKTAIAINTDTTDDTATAENNDDVVIETKTAVAATPAAKRSREYNYEQERMYIVQKGDSLFSIAKKHPGVTVENLKNWNKIQGESIQPGMKLKLVEVN
ncbi:lytic transglycosylase domain-containing protein [Flavobacterium cerinum]|uniref:LysM peptidoglycan-binding domain-containing protein n=1 Tax=Flavobacterium cerinum TaxID=2502784 RepID=A0A444HA99_9FLAO|nr:lytic transglycosylase domain-containing protein [Flavobacterium cerinum]RWX00096.1 LysM peptidoglycan-binding domain-containing protein [Flavobacterium cerinum]